LIYIIISIFEEGIKIKSQKTLKFLIIMLVSISLIMNSHQVVGTAVDESEFIDFLENNPETIIFDLRWMELYEKFHLNGSYLIDSSLTDEQIQTRAMEIIDARGANSSTAMGMYCNCGDGLEASKLEAYLVSQEYTNTVWLSYSFSIWSNRNYLVEGPDRIGPPIDDGNNGGGPANGGIDPLILVGVSGGIILLGGVSYFYFSNTKKIKNIDDEMSKIESKKSKELESLSKLLSDKKTVEETRKDRRPRRR
jgi:rhodanese-related sulfurtransferase